MEFSELSDKALEIKEKYEQLETNRIGRPWTRQERFQAFNADVGRLTKLVMAKEGLRNDIEDIDKNLAHKFSDCLWCIFVLAKEYGIILENSFVDSMAELDKKVSEQLNN